MRYIHLGKLTEKRIRYVQDQGYQALLMPELVQFRLSHSNRHPFLLEEQQDTQSLMITGIYGRDIKTICVHNYTSWNNPKNIKHARENPFISLYSERIPKHFPFPQKEFESLVERIGDEKVLEVEQEKLEKYPSRDYSLDEALRHPLTIPFFGKEDLAKEYLRIYCKRQGKIEISHKENIPGQIIVLPHGRFLGLNRGLCASNDLTGKYNFLWKK